MNGQKGSHLAAQKHGECETRGGGCGCIGPDSGGSDGDRIHVDRCHGWDAWGHVVDEVGRWHVIGGHGGGVTAEYGIEGGADVHERGWGGKRGRFWV